jgi:hypothetical protein
MRMNVPATMTMMNDAGLSEPARTLLLLTATRHRNPDPMSPRF